MSGLNDRTIEYQAEVDGLRAIAVLGVIFFHASFEFFTGGYIGVDVFFVISGYLISGIILSQLESGRFSLENFYSRRIKRIFPALFFVIAITVPFAYYWMLPNELSEYWKGILSVVTFTSNIYLWRQSDYFSQEAEVNPLLHTWSLAVEEQYYLFFPFIFMIFFTVFRRKLFFCVLVIVITSFISAEIFSNSHPVANFYLLPTRIWEFGIGVLCAIWSKRSFHQLSSLTREFISIVGLFAILVSFLVFDSDTATPSFVVLLPVAGAAAVILFANKDTVVGAILSRKLIVKIGLLSYSAYLWHQPIFAFARIRVIEPLSALSYGFLILITFFCAYVTWRFIEVPLRRADFMSPRSTIGAGLAVCIVVALSTFLLPAHYLQLRNYSPEVLSIAKSVKSISPLRDECHATENNLIKPKNACIIGDNDNELVYLWGDSHGVELALQLSNELKSANLSIKQLTASQCLPIVNVGSLRENHCRAYNDKVHDYLLSVPAGQTIVMVARWSLYFEGDRFTNQYGHTEPGGWGGRFVIDHSANDPHRIENLGRATRNAILELINYGHKVVLVHSMPEVGFNVPNTLARAELFGNDKYLNYATNYSLVKLRMRRAYEELKISSDRYFQIYPEHIFCGTFSSGTCAVHDSGRPFYFDSNHLSLPGATLVAKQAAKVILENR